MAISAANLFIVFGWLCILVFLVFHVFKTHETFIGEKVGFVISYNRTSSQNIGHDIKCEKPHELINGFALRLDEKNNGYYEYTCSGIQGGFDIEQQPATWTNTNDVVHNVGEACGENSGLSRFKLLSSQNGSKTNYEYNCSKMISNNISNACQSRETEWFVEKPVDKRIQCSTKEILKNFRLVNDCNEQGECSKRQKFVYTCCEPKFVERKVGESGIVEIPDQVVAGGL